MLHCNWGAGIIKMNDDVKRSLYTIAIKRGIVRN